jgi:hypothetical protein
MDKPVLLVQVVEEAVAVQEALIVGLILALVPQAVLALCICMYKK